MHRHCRGRRHSLPRKLVLEFLEQNIEEHFSAKQIYEQLLQKNMQIGIASIYRNLEFLSSADFIKKYNFDGETRYQYKNDTQHHHLILNNDILDIELSKALKTTISDFIKEIEKQKSIKITNYELIFKGHTPNNNED